MDEIDNGVVSIQYTNFTEEDFIGFTYYTMQGPFLVISFPDRTVHINEKCIDNFIYTPKENN